MDYKLKHLVKWFLENEIETRNDDDLLCALVAQRVDPRVQILSYVEVCKNPGKYGLYSRESITRERRELQAEYPELKGIDYVTRRRARREKQYREYYREKKNGTE